jgi:MoaA/NifB/PqqE/SkfB family radical SAM enzyme
MGGEITHWPKFFELIEFCKTRYDCIFTLTTNGSKKLKFWEKAAPYLDYVIISTHHQFCDPAHVRDVADLLYEKNVIVNTAVLMDPFEWDKCMGIVDFYKKSKHRWTIRYLEIIHDDVIYTDEQKEVFRKLRARGPNLFWFFKNNKSYRSKVKVVDTNDKIHNVGDQAIVLERMNNFNHWECNLGVDWVAVKTDGTVSGVCGNGLYANNETFNLFDTDFPQKFAPKIEPVTCTQTNGCWCMYEAKMTKRKIIPIKHV